MIETLIPAERAIGRPPGLSEEDEELRRTGIGASESPKILGLSPPSWGGPLDVYLRLKGLTEKTAPTDAMLDGLYSEAGIMQWYCDRTGAELARIPTQRHAVYPFILGSVDRLRVDTGDYRIVEAKRVGYKMSHHWQGPDGVELPPYVEVQVLQQMEVTGIRRADVAAVIAFPDGLRHLVISVDYHPGRAEKLVRGLVHFWRTYVEADLQPPPDGTSTFTAWLEARHPTARGEMLQGTADDWEMLTEYERLKKDSDPMLERMDAIKNAFRARIGDADGIEGICNWRNQRGRINYKAACEAAGVDVTEFRGPDIRVFKWWKE